MKSTARILPFFLLLAGCGPSRVTQFAGKANDLLGEYQKKVDAQITDSTTYYQAAATTTAGQVERVGIQTLEEEREERATQLEADYREGRRPVSLYRNDLKAYADVDFAALKARLNLDEEASAPYLTQLVALQSDESVIDGYSKILKNIAKPRAIKDEIGDLQQFVSDSKTEFDKLVCDGISKQITSSPPPSAEKKASLAALQKNCPKT